MKYIATRNHEEYKFRSLLSPPPPPLLSPTISNARDRAGMM